jgi:pimeloyl-ACP methyl ester carboxylesterase
MLMLASTLTATPAFAGQVSLKTTDGVPLVAQVNGEGVHGVVLVHEESRSSSDWTYLSEKLGQLGYHVISVDLRGHGKSSPGGLPDEDYSLMITDVGAGAQWLRSNGADRIVMIGAGLGANLALNAAGNDEGISGIGLLSPGLNIKGVKVSRALTAYGSRPLLLAAGSNDTSGTRAAQAIADNASGESELHVLSSAGVGVRMLNRSADPEGLLLLWLRDVFELDERDMTREVADHEELETRGEKFGE